jgi:hypothetical protein
MPVVHDPPIAGNDEAAGDETAGDDTGSIAFDGAAEPPIEPPIEPPLGFAGPPQAPSAIPNANPSTWRRRPIGVEYSAALHAVHDGRRRSG